jgi:hypothetical protein
MRYRHDVFFSTDTQYMLQKRILQPYSVVNGFTIYKDTLHKKWCFYTDELGRVERKYGKLSQLLIDLANYLKVDPDDIGGENYQDVPATSSGF